MPSRRAVASDVAVAAGVLLLVASFMPWWGLSGVPGGAPTLNAWQASPAWWVPVLAGTALAGAWLLRRVGRIEALWLPAVTFAVGMLGLVLVLSEWSHGVQGLVGDFGWYAYAPVSESATLPFGARIGLLLGFAALLVQTSAAATVLRAPRG